MTNQFCAFCKDARARMSFISYYSATIEALSNNQAKIGALEGEMEDALQLFYDWEYFEAVEAIVSTYHEAEAPSPTGAFDLRWIPLIISAIIGALGLAFLLRRRLSKPSKHALDEGNPQLQNRLLISQSLWNRSNSTVVCD